MAKVAQPRFSIGVDYGTNSVRAVVVDIRNGREVAECVYGYPSGTDGILLEKADPNLARQNPADYVKGFDASVKGAVTAAGRVRGFDPARVVGIGIDTTGSTPIPVDAAGVPLAMKAPYKKLLAAQAWLWKDHTGHAEAAEITDLAARMGLPYLAKCGMTYSSEWFWAKILHCRRTAPKVFAAASSWVELSDFVPAYATGTLDPARMTRNVCAAGHKAMYAPQWGGLPAKSFLRRLSPEVARLRDRLYDHAVPSNQPAGGLAAAVAKKVGLPAGIVVAAGALDAHHGGVGAGIKPGTLVKIIGTSTCDLMVVPESSPPADIPGVCGIVDGSVLPGMYGLEAGQSAVGDIFNWFVANLCPPEYAAGDPHRNLSRAAAKLRPGASGLMGLDWNNGNRTVLVDPLLTGLLIGQTLHTSAPEIYRALIEATGFGALTIINRFEQYGVKVNEVINCGGIAEKNPLVMQIYADICNRPMKISRSAQSCALGAAIFGAVVGGAYRTVRAAQRKMTGVKATVYRPIRANVRTYRELSAIYTDLHDAFGTDTRDGAMGGAMKKLIAIRDRVRKG